MIAVLSIVCLFLLQGAWSGWSNSDGAPISANLTPAIQKKVPSVEVGSRSDSVAAFLRLLSAAAHFISARMGLTFVAWPVLSFKVDAVDPQLPAACYWDDWHKNIQVLSWGYARSNLIVQAFSLIESVVHLESSVDRWVHLL